MLNEPCIEDCPVCCRPMNIHAVTDGDGRLTVDVSRDDD